VKHPPFNVRLPIADWCRVEINDGDAASLTLTDIRAADYRLRLLFGGRPPSL
jgi:hypothetical protein